MHKQKHNENRGKRKKHRRFYDHITVCFFFFLKLVFLTKITLPIWKTSMLDIAQKYMDIRTRTAPPLLYIMLEAVQAVQNIILLKLNSLHATTFI